MEDFVTFEIAKKLKEKGFNKKCLFAYNDEQIINPKVVEEYGYLTDDGYYELTEDGGGKLKFDNVYIYEQQIILRDKIIIERNFIDAPTISQVLKWLREEKELHIEIYMYHNCYLFEIYNTKIYDADFTQKSEKYSEIEYENYEESALAGIIYVLDNLI